MKKLVLAFALVAGVVSSAAALTLQEAYKLIDKLPDLAGVESGRDLDLLGGWVSAIPFETARITYKEHEVGGVQTEFYGNSVEDVVRQLPKDKMVLHGANYSNLIYFFADQYDNESSELLILVDQSYQGKTVAVICKVDNRIIKALEAGAVSFTPDYKIVVTVPIMVCD